MKVFYCRVGWMSSYKGCLNEKPVNGGAYNKENIGHEIHNFLGYNGKYYGFVEPGVNCSIHVERLNGDNKKADYAEDILVVWVSSKPNATGQYIVGWYKNATIYRELQNVPDDAMDIRKLKTHCYYNIFSENAILLEEGDRNFHVKGMGQKNIWYGNYETDKRVEEYIEKLDSQISERIEIIEKGTSGLEGKVRDSVVKTRVNQDKFRERLLATYKKCCLCAVSDTSLLVASHIKPWAVSDKFEKLDVNNGLLLCPNHDRLFDIGYISFDDTGKIMVSASLSEVDKTFMNITNSMSINVNEDNVAYIRYHRENIYKK